MKRYDSFVENPACLKLHSQPINRWRHLQGDALAIVRFGKLKW